MNKNIFVFQTRDTFDSVMSVQNLRNKFSQNNGTVPYNPPGLSYGKPMTAGHHNHAMTSSTLHGQQNGGLRFKTIREEPDGVTDEKPSVTPQRATRNTSFLQNYLSNEMTTAVGKSSPTTHIPVHQTSAVRTSSTATDATSKFRAPTFVKSPPSVHRTTKFNISSAAMSDVKSPTPTKFTTVYKVPPSTPPESSSANSVDVHESSPLKVTTANGSQQSTIDGKWKIKYDETEVKRKGLLTQSQKRDYTYIYY